MSFWINVVVKICKPLSKLDIPTRRKCRTEKKDATEQMKNLTLARTRTQVPVISSADAFATKQRVPVAEPESLSL